VEKVFFAPCTLRGSKKKFFSTSEELLARKKSFFRSPGTFGLKKKFFSTPEELLARKKSFFRSPGTFELKKSFLSTSEMRRGQIFVADSFLYPLGVRFGENAGL